MVMRYSMYLDTYDTYNLRYNPQQQMEKKKEKEEEEAATYLPKPPKSPNVEEKMWQWDLDQKKMTATGRVLTTQITTLESFSFFDRRNKSKNQSQYRVLLP